MPYILPQQAPRQTGWDQAGFAAGTATDLLIKALLAGQLGMPPQQGRPQGMQGPNTASGQFYPQSQPNRPVKIGPFQTQPNYNNQLQQLQVQKAQQDLDPNSPQNQLIRQYTQSLSGGGSQQPTHYQDPTTGQLVMDYGGKKYKVTGIDPQTGKPLYDPL